MKKTTGLCKAIIICSLLLAGCTNGAPTQVKEARSQQTEAGSPTGQPAALAAPSSTPVPSGQSIPLASPTGEPLPSPSPTPLFVFDLSGYDADLLQPIDVSHNPPLIARAGDTILLVFDLVNTIYCEDLQRYCRLDPKLFYTYGDSDAFRSLPLTAEIVDEMESLVARLPATDPAGKSLRYYAEFEFPEAGYSLRYPAAGTIDLFAVESFIPVELLEEHPMQDGEKVYTFPWGFGLDQVRQATYPDYPQRVGPPAMDVANDGRIALLDPVNERVLVYDPLEDSYASLPLPFAYRFWGDIAFDLEDRLVVFDWTGEEAGDFRMTIPYFYRLLPDGVVDRSGQVFVRSPAHITKDLGVLDYYDARLVAPVDAQGEPNTREAQREKETWDLPKRYAAGKDPYVAQYADVENRAAFEVHSVSPLGVLTEFAKTPQGYLLTFNIGDHIRAAWIDPAGKVLKDISLPNGGYAEVNFYGQVAIDRDGSLYTLSSTERGIEIHYVAAP